MGRWCNDVLSYIDGTCNFTDVNSDGKHFGAAQRHFLKNSVCSSGDAGFYIRLRNVTIVG
jgi:hypothetical protein